jgi:hypothetical protein
LASAGFSSSKGGCHTTAEKGLFLTPSPHRCRLRFHATANALRDVYTMGGVPKIAMSLVAFPVEDLDIDIRTPGGRHFQRGWRRRSFFSIAIIEAAPEGGFLGYLSGSDFGGAEFCGTRPPWRLKDAPDRNNWRGLS